MRSSNSNQNFPKPNKIVTSMHIYSTKNLKSGKINPEPINSKQVEARRKKSNINTAELIVEGQNIQKIFPGRISPTKDYALQDGSVYNSLNPSIIDYRKNGNHFEKRNSEKVEGISAASLLFEQQKQVRHINNIKSGGLRSQPQGQQVNPQRIVVSRVQQVPVHRQSNKQLQKNITQRESRYRQKPLTCPVCNSWSCSCLHIGGDYKNCSHCRKQQFRNSHSQTAPDVSAVQYLQDRILSMLENDFKQF